ncbi:hypothetical protein QSI67_21425 [Escherichia coli]|uniref:hypothetical protein n=1 Tax=Escherichia coli TaxID=562 RepID=UPI0006675106|nr:hypothetical protein [Escherichia coli]EJD0140645.1 hypothetical protein [Escherichia coli]MBB0791792.1 hypothetical protein [Escherichia coli]MDK2418086.1 hypothetical protein [Escherichia coli]MDK2447256.1 hypothetical protein [Escherichia coli]MDS2002040.1 hypothetical protein [Escherichia coli]
MTRKEYLHQLAQEIAQEIISMNQPLIDRIVTAEVDKIKFQLASLAPNMAAMRSEMLAVMGSNSSLGVYLANVDKLQADKSDIATNAFTAQQQAPNPREYFGENLDDFTRKYFDGELDDFTRQYFDGDDLVNKSIREYFDGSDEFNRRLDDYFHMGE